MIETILTSISLGLLSSASPCILPLYPGFLAYLAGRQEGIQSRIGRYSLGFLVLAGVLSMMLLLGLVISLLSISIGIALTVIIPIAYTLIILLGVLLLLDINPFKAMPQLQVPVLNNPYVNAYVYGLLYGPIALPCSGPLVVGIFTFSLTSAEVISKLTIFFWFGIGFGLPLLMLSFLSGAVQQRLVRSFALHSRKINLAGGILLVVVGVFGLTKNWEMIATYLKIWLG